jgi:hypothetical protein
MARMNLLLNVHCVDKNPNIIKVWNSEDLPIWEPGLEGLLNPASTATADISQQGDQVSASCYRITDKCGSSKSKMSRGPCSYTKLLTAFRTIIQKPKTLIPPIWIMLCNPSWRHLKLARLLSRKVQFHLGRLSA